MYKIKDRANIYTMNESKKKLAVSIITIMTHLALFSLEISDIFLGEI